MTIVNVLLRHPHCEGCTVDLPRVLPNTEECHDIEVVRTLLTNEIRNHVSQVHKLESHPPFGIFNIKMYLILPPGHEFCWLDLGLTSGTTGDQFLTAVELWGQYHPGAHIPIYIGYEFLFSTPQSMTEDTELTSRSATALAYHAAWSNHSDEAPANIVLGGDRDDRLTLPSWKQRYVQNQGAI